MPYQTKALLFDLDDTLYHRGEVFRRWSTSFAQKYFPHQQASYLQEVIDLLVTLDMHGYAAREELFTEFLRAYPLSTISPDTFVETYRAQLCSYIEYNAQLVAFLRALGDVGIPFGIVTNGSAHQQPKIEKLGLDQLTSCIFISEVFGAKKPDSSIFLAAAACLQVPAEQILFVGDNPAFDIWGAHQVGMRTVWLRRSIEWPATLSRNCVDITINTLEELIALLSHV